MMQAEKRCIVGIANQKQITFFIHNYTRIYRMGGKHTGVVLSKMLWTCQKRTVLLTVTTYSRTAIYSLIFICSLFTWFSNCEIPLYTYDFNLYTGHIVWVIKPVSSLSRKNRLKCKLHYHWFSTFVYTGRFVLYLCKRRWWRNYRRR